MRSRREWPSLQQNDVSKQIVHSLESISYFADVIWIGARRKQAHGYLKRPELGKRSDLQRQQNNKVTKTITRLNCKHVKSTIEAIMQLKEHNNTYMYLYMVKLLHVHD